jgi:hypothetical protein
VSLPIHKSAANYVIADLETHYVAADSKIGSQKNVSLLIHKSAGKNFSPADSEINSQLCLCQFRNRQPKTMSLLIHKTITKNYAAVDSEIDSQLCSCRFRN